MGERFAEKTKERAEFIRLMGLSQKEREELGLGTAVKIYERLGVRANTYARWLKKYKKDGAGGHFDIQGFLKENKQEIAESLLSLIKGKKSVKSVEVALRALGELAEKKEVGKVEFTAVDYIRIARETIDGLREQYKQSSGICPVCLQPKVLLNEAHVVTE